MLLAAVRDTPYNIMLILHILTAMAAFAPAFAHPLITTQGREFDGASRRTLMGFLVQNGRRVYAPALILNGLLGFALAGMSDKVYSMSDTWLVLAFVAWIAMNGVLHGVIVPAERAMSNGDFSAERRVSAGGAAISLLLLVQLWLMVFKPFI
ncbi:MAG: putative membrane protein [Candidatus Poriferisodalaceae bacterium]|jgi:uncharacterized membrane protein